MREREDGEWDDGGRLHHGNDRHCASRGEAEDLHERAADGGFGALELGGSEAVHSEQVGRSTQHERAEELHLGRDPQLERHAIIREEAPQDVLEL